jgi:uncharacterized BrkB/YihY/UPF0761 family membrane protein
MGMSYQEKRTLASIVTGVLVVAAYCINAFGKIQSQTADQNDLKFWSTTMLIFIGIGVAAVIVVQIVFHILFSISIAVKERNCNDKEIEKRVEAAVKEDEMDKLIELKSMRLGFSICGAGFIAALISLALNSSAAVMLNILFLSFSLGSLLEGVMSLHYYRAGVKNA